MLHLVGQLLTKINDARNHEHIMIYSYNLCNYASICVTVNFKKEDYKHINF